MSRAVPRFRRNNPALPPAVPNLFEVIVQGLVDGQMTINTFYYADGGGTLITASETNLVNGWFTAFSAHFAAATSADFTLSSIKGQCLTTPTRVAYTLPVGTAGTGPAGHQPSTVCATFDRYSGVKGQAGRGRVSMPAVPNTWVTASLINATGIAAYATFLNDLKTGFVASGVTYVAQVVSRKNKAGPALGASPVLNSTLRTTLGTCRRRKLGRGK